MMSLVKKADMTENAKIKFKSKLNVVVSRFTDNMAELEFALPLLKKGGYTFGVLRKSDGRLYIARKSEDDDKKFPDIIEKDDHCQEELIYYYR